MDFTAVCCLIHLKFFFQLQFRLIPVSFLHYLSECESNTQNLKTTRPLGTRVQNNTGFQTAPSFISVYKADIWWWLCAVLRRSFVEGEKNRAVNPGLELGQPISDLHCDSWQAI